MTIEAMVFIFAVLVFVAVAITSLYVIGTRNSKQAELLAKLTERKQALEILRHSIDYLSQFGIGDNLEYSSARTILELAMIRVFEA